MASINVTCAIRAYTTSWDSTAPTGRSRNPAGSVDTPLNPRDHAWDTTQGRTVASCRASGGARPGLAVYSGMAAFRRDVEPRHRKTRPTARRRHVGRAH